MPNGDVCLRISESTPTPAQRFRLAADRVLGRSTVEGDCLVFRGHRKASGYGWAQTPDGPRFTHRIVYEATYGPIPAGLCVLHHCDNRPCVKPEHLWLGTKADNLRDMREKGRAVQVAGESCGTARWSSATVEELRRRVMNGEPVAEAARSLGMPVGTACGIVRADSRAYDGIPEGWEPRDAVAERRARHAELARQYRAGATTVAIAAAIGTFPGNVSRILRNQGVTMRPGKPPFRYEYDAEILRRLQAGGRVRTIAAAVGVSRGVVNRVRIAAGIPAAPPGPPPRLSVSGG